MHAILVAFAAPSEAYAFVSEIRRRADSMLWDVRVRRAATDVVVVVPERVWRREGFVRSVAERYGGVVRGDDRARDRATGMMAEGAGSRPSDRGSDARVGPV